MNKQINLRLPETLLVSVQNYAEKHGFGTTQEFIKETIREKLFGESGITKKELILVKRLAQLSEKKNFYGSEKELFKKLRRK